MARANQNPSGGLIAVAAVIVALPFLVSPLIVGSLASPEQKLSLQLEPQVTAVLSMLHKSDESLLRVSDLRQRLGAAGAELTAETAAQVAEAKPEILEGVDAELKPGGSLSTDRILAASEAMALATAGEIGGQAATRGLPGKGAAYAQKSFKDLSTLIKENETLLQTAESSIKSARAESVGEVTGAADYWVNRAAAMVSLARGRTLRDKAWLDRWQAEMLRMVARDQALKSLELRRLSDASAGRAPTEAIEAATKHRAALQKTASELREKADVLKRDAAAQRARIDKLTADAKTARDAMAAQDLKPFKATNAMKAGEEFKKYRDEYERLSAAARQAESQAESLRSGAMVGGELAEGADGDLLTGSYDGAKPGVGLTTMEARLGELESRLAAVEADENNVKAELAELNKTAQQLDEERTKQAEEADKLAAEAKKTMARVEEAMKSAAQSEEAAVAALSSGIQYTQAAQTAAKNRVRDATDIKNEANAEKTAERLTHVLSDKDTEAAALTTAAGLLWAAADCYAQGIADELSQKEFAATQAKLLGEEAGEAAATHVDAWRKSAQEKLATAAQRLSEAKQMIAAARFEGLDAPPVVGANYKWTVSQLEAGVHLLSAALAESDEAMKDALAKARASLQETVTGRENSPNLSAAVAALKTLP